MKINLFLTLIAFMFIAILPGCTESVAEDYYLDEAPGIKITGEAMKVLTSNSEAHNLSYKVLTS